MAITIPQFEEWHYHRNNWLEGRYYTYLDDGTFLWIDVELDNEGVNETIEYYANNSDFWDVFEGDKPNENCDIKRECIDDIMLENSWVFISDCFGEIFEGLMFCDYGSIDNMLSEAYSRIVEAASNAL